jgi:ribose-phosphate pyrophosphokinase
VVHAAPLVSKWIKANVTNPLIIGPDSESEQWVAAVASDAHAPYSVLEKVRRGDRDVEIRLKDLEQWKGRTPVLVDDIISTGRTMIEAVRLRLRGWPSQCASRSMDFSPMPTSLPLGRVVTTQHVPHKTNAMDIENCRVYRTQGGPTKCKT